MTYNSRSLARMSILLLAALLVLALPLAVSAAPCTTVCYVDAAAGNDANGGTSAADAFQTIQKAIDTVAVGGEVRILPGSYNETATNRFVLGVNGPHQFGLFIAKNGVTLQGVTAADVAITDPTATEADISTNATNNFGTSGIFVEGDGVTIAGLEIGPNIPGENKTIEIIGNAFTLKDSFVAGDGIDGGFPYVNDWRYDAGTNTAYVESYTFDNNLFGAGSQISISSGAGGSGPVSGRQITGNVFSMGPGQNWASISFNGNDTTVPWFTYPVGGAVITGNTFTNTAVGGQHIRVRGVIDDSEFDWASYWNDNTFNKAVVAGLNPPSDVRAWSYVSGSYTFNGVRVIGADIQPEIGHAQPGDTVLVNEGAYPESPNIDKSLTLLGEDGRDLTTIDLQAGPTYLGSLTIGGADVTVQGFTIEGFDAVGAGLASTNVLVNSTPTSVVLMDNRFKVGQVGAGTNGDDGFGILTTYAIATEVASLEVENNEFMPVGAAGGRRAFYVNPGVNVFEFEDNTITGNFTASALTQAKDGLVEDNILTGTGTSRGLGTWGYPDPAVYGATLFRGNVISDVVNGITIFGSENVTVTKNTFTGNDRAVYVAEDDPFDLSTIHINRNSIAGNDMGVENWWTTDVDATCNWWGAADGPGPVGPGSGDMVSAYVAFAPWLKSSDLDGSCFTGKAFFSPFAAGMVDAIAYGPEDVLAYDATTDQWSMFFDGSAYGLTTPKKWKQNINAVYVPDPNSPVGMVMSFWHNRRPVLGIPGFVNGQDLVQFNGTDFDMYFDGSDVGLTVATAEKIDGLHILPGAASPIGGGCQAYLLISTQGPGWVPNYSGGKLKFKGEDVLGFCATNLGDDTTGLWHMVLDGSAEGMPGNATDSLSASADGTKLYLMTKAAFHVDSANGGHSMVYVYDFSTGEFSGPIFSAPAEGLPKADALDILFN